MLEIFQVELAYLPWGGFLAECWSAWAAEPLSIGPLAADATAEVGVAWVEGRPLLAAAAAAAAAACIQFCVIWDASKSFA